MGPISTNTGHKPRHSFTAGVLVSGCALFSVCLEF